MSTLPRKVSKLQLLEIRTVNRHRWEGREDQGERVIAPQGTRQKSGRKLAIRPADRIVWNTMRTQNAKIKTQNQSVKFKTTLQTVSTVLS